MGKKKHKKENHYVYVPVLGGPRQWTRDPDGNIVTTCPNCGKMQILVHARNGGHAIDPKGDDGDVRESIICSYGCGFHEHGILERWGLQERT